MLADITQSLIDNSIILAKTTSVTKLNTHLTNRRKGIPCVDCLDSFDRLDAMVFALEKYVVGSEYNELSENEIQQVIEYVRGIAGSHSETDYEYIVQYDDTDYFITLMNGDKIRLS